VLKAVLIAVGALLLFLALVGGIVFGAQSLSVPVSNVEQQDCLSRAKTEHARHPECPKTETVWARGLADPVAFYTLWLTLFTLALAIGAAVQSGLIARQIGLARDEFNATHRPRIRVRYISIPISPDSGNAFGVIVANAGESDAIITAYQIDVFIIEEPVNIGIELKPHTFQEIRLKSGERHVFPTETNGWFAPDPWLLLGRITYTDAARQITRMTGFARELDLNWNAYSVSKIHPESEYED
jgi:hypothetical protein